jgi:CheY-like chemotaxis protein
MDRWRLDPAVRAAARFQQGNLVDPDWPAGVPPQDVVFCRNVLIYFDETPVRRAVDNLYRVVRPGGYLFLGHAETLSRIPTRFVPSVGRVRVLHATRGVRVGQRRSRCSSWTTRRSCGARSADAGAAGRVEVVGTACERPGGGGAGRSRLRPDVVILDIVMPEVDGLEAIRADHGSGAHPHPGPQLPRPPGAEITLQGPGAGRRGLRQQVRRGTRMDIYDLGPVLREKVLASPGPACRPRWPAARPSRPAPPPPPASAVRATRSSSSAPPPAGPGLVSILSALPADFPAGVVVAQHMPPASPVHARRATGPAVRASRSGRRRTATRIRPGLALLGWADASSLEVERERELVVRIPTGATDSCIARPWTSSSSPRPRRSGPGRGRGAHRHGAGRGRGWRRYGGRRPDPGGERGDAP